MELPAYHSGHQPYDVYSCYIYGKVLVKSSRILSTLRSQYRVFRFSVARLGLSSLDIEFDMLRRLFLVVGLPLLFVTSIFAQDFSALTRAYPDSLCTYCTSWDEPHQPFQIHHNSWYVGTHGLSAILVTSPGGHILIDGALPSSVPLILENIATLGFDAADIKLILNSHAHFDHAGGIAALQHVSKARVAASPESAVVLEQGKGGANDPQYGMLLDFPAVPNVERFTPGEALEVGTLKVTSHATAGHSPGGTSWSWMSCDEAGEDCLNIVYADSQTPVSADGFHYSDSESYPEGVSDFEKGLETLENLDCDILISTHPSASSLWKRYEQGAAGLLDPNACRRYAEAGRKRLAERLEREAAESKENPGG